MALDPYVGACTWNLYIRKENAQSRSKPKIDVNSFYIRQLQAQPKGAGRGVCSFDGAPCHVSHPECPAKTASGGGKMNILSIRGGEISYCNGGKRPIRRVRPVSLYIRDWAKEAVFLNGKNKPLQSSGAPQKDALGYVASTISLIITSFLNSPPLAWLFIFTKVAGCNEVGLPEKATDQLHSACPNF